MSDRVVVLASSDERLVAGLSGSLGSGVTVLSARNGDELGRILTGGQDIAIVVSHLRERAAPGWRQLAIIHDALPDLPILVYLDAGAVAWDERDGPVPADQILRAPIVDRELARLVSTAGGLPIDGRVRGSADAPRWSNDAIAVIGLAGGVGSTVVAATTARAISADRPVVVADLDQRHGTLTASLQPHVRYMVNDLRDALDDPGRLDESLVACLVSVRERLSLLPAPEFGTIAAQHSALENIFGSLVRTLPCFVADLGDLDPRAFRMLADASGVIVVTTSNPATLRRLPTVIERLAAVAPSVPVRTVLNMVEAAAEPTPAQLERAANVRFDAVLPVVGAVQKHGWDAAGTGLADPALRLGRRFDAQLTALIDPAAGSNAIGLRRKRTLGRPLPIGDVHG